jgi:hypothetical protein
MLHQFELIGVPLPLQRQLWSRPNVRAMTTRRRRALRRRLQGIVLAPPQRRHRQARHG